MNMKRSHGPRIRKSRPRPRRWSKPGLRRSPQNPPIYRYITAIARYSYQNGVPFVDRNFGTFGFTMSYDVFDFGKRRATVREREAKLTQAEENLDRLKEAVGVEVERSYNKVERTKQMVHVANEVARVAGQKASGCLAENQFAQGVVLVSTRRQASAANLKAQANLLQAQLGYLLAGAELEQTIGRTPGL